MYKQTCWFWFHGRLTLSMIICFFRVELIEAPSHLWLCMPRIVMANVELFELSGKVGLSLYISFILSKNNTSSSFIGTAEWTDTCSSYIESLMIFFQFGRSFNLHALTWDLREGIVIHWYACSHAGKLHIKYEYLVYICLRRFTIFYLLIGIHGYIFSLMAQTMNKQKHSLYSF